MIKYYTSNLLKAYQDGVVNKAYINGEVAYQRISVSPQPTPDFKWIATYQDGHTESAECDASSAITQGEITLTNLVDVELGNCVNTIGQDAFTNYISLTSVTIPDSVTSIGDYAFWGCASLANIDIPSGVTSIGNYAFNRCYGLQSIVIYATIPPTLGSDVFPSSDYPIIVPSCKAVNAYKAAWPEYADRITTTDECFKWLATYQGGHTESGECTTSTTIVSGEITRTDLQKLEIGDCTTVIADSVFSSFPFTSVTIGENVTSIGNYTFENCTNMVEFKIYANTPPTLGAYLTFAGTNCDLQVPAESVDAYKAAWSDYSSRIVAME